MSDCDCGQCQLRRAREAVEPAPSPQDHWNDPRPRAPLTTHEQHGQTVGDPPAGTGALLAGVPAELHDAARALVYIVCRIEAAGPTDRLAFPDIDDNGHITDALEHAGLIATYQTPDGVTRWERHRHERTRR